MIKRKFFINFVIYLIACLRLHKCDNVTASSNIPTPSLSSSSSISSMHTNGVGGALTTSLHFSITSTITRTLSSTTTNVSPTPTLSVTTTKVTPQVTTPPPKPDTTISQNKGKSHCNMVDDGFCKNNGVCVNKTKQGEVMQPACVCPDMYYGETCENKDEFPYLYKQLTYAFGGTTAFLLLVICFMICCSQSRKRSKKNAALDYSQELDEFTIANKRASTQVNLEDRKFINSYDMYSAEPNEP